MNKNLAGMVFAVALVVGLAPLSARAQQNPVSSAVRQVVSRHAKIMVAAAQEMPANKFNYAPTPEQMTFGHLTLHIAQSDLFFCSRISGEKAPAIGHLTEHSPKSQLVTALKSAFGFCEQSLAKVNDGELSQEVEFFGGRKVTKAAALIALSNDLYDHYSQQAMYLRLNGHLPPTAQHHGRMK